MTEPAEAFGTVSPIQLLSVSPSPHAWASQEEPQPCWTSNDVSVFRTQANSIASQGWEQLTAAAMRSECWAAFSRQHHLAELEQAVNSMEGQLNDLRRERALAASARKDVPGFSFFPRQTATAKYDQRVQKAQAALEQASQEHSRVRSQLRELEAERERLCGEMAWQPALLFYAPDVTPFIGELEQRHLLSIVRNVPALALQCRPVCLSPTYPEREQYGVRVYWLDTGELALQQLGSDEQPDARIALQGLLEWQQQFEGGASLVAEWLWQATRTNMIPSRS